ncbi:MAG: FG-GAP-like repeat-containing protein [Cyanobacteria bacterium P01_G01_bin.39]
MTKFTKVDIELTGQLGKITTGDFDSDGDLDLLVSGRDDNFLPVSEIYTNDGSANFSKNAELNLSAVSSIPLVTGDFDGDDDLDLLSIRYPRYDSNFSPTAEIYINDGADFSQGNEFKLPDLLGGLIATEDFDGDGDLDLLVTERSPGYHDTIESSISIYANDGKGGFNRNTKVIKTGSFSPQGLAKGDFDGDDDIDLLITGVYGDISSISDITEIYINDGAGDFSKAEKGLFRLGSSKVVTGDFDGDGDLDLLLARSFPGFMDNGITNIYTNDGSGNFSEAENSLPDADISHISAITTGDFDGDSDLDLLITGQDYSLNKFSKIYQNDGSGNFSEDTEVMTDLSFGDLVTGDFDGDSDLDLLITGTDYNRNDIAEIHLNNNIHNSGHDILKGTDSDDDLDGGAGNDVIFALAGNDILAGGDGDDRLHGQSGRDVINGGAGHDTLFGGGDIDILNGGDDDDYLNGRNGFDRLNGGDGDDYLEDSDGITIYTGGNGSDTFIFDRDGSVDWVGDYEIGVDRIGLAEGLTFEGLEITGRANSNIFANGDRIGVLLGVNPNDLDADNFLEVD